MSIWCSHPTIGFDDWPDDDEPNPQGGQVRSYAYGWSNHYPTMVGSVEREAMLDLAHTPVWCVPGHRDELSESVGPWLRLGVQSWKHDYHKPEDVLDQCSAVVVMDENAVRALVTQLNEWLELPKAHPVVEAVES